MKKLLTSVLLAYAAFSASVSAWAVSLTGITDGAEYRNQTVTGTFNADQAGSGTLSFTLSGVQLDVADTFTLWVNGVKYGSGGFSFPNPTTTNWTWEDGYGGSLTAYSGNTGVLFFDVVIDVVANSNSVSFAYGSLTGNEKWSLSGVSVAVSPVPEPGTYALMVAGLGVVGWAARRRKLAPAIPAQALPA